MTGINAPAKESGFEPINYFMDKVIIFQGRQYVSLFYRPLGVFSRPFVKQKLINKLTDMFLFFWQKVNGYVPAT